MRELRHKFACVAQLCPGRVELNVGSANRGRELAMLRIGTLVLAVAVCFCAPKAVRADDAEMKLLKVVDIDKAVEESLKSIIGYLSDRFDLKIEIDKAAFAAEKRQDPSKSRIFLPKCPGITLDTVLRLALPQLDAVYEIRDKGIAIVPAIQDGKRRQFPPYSKDQLKILKQAEIQRGLGEKVSKLKVDLDKSIDAPVKDVLEFLSDRYDLTIIIDPTELRNAGEEMVHIEKGKYTFKELMSIVLKGIKATYRVEPDHIRIVRQRES